MDDVFSGFPVVTENTRTFSPASFVRFFWTQKNSIREHATYHMHIMAHRGGGVIYMGNKLPLLRRGIKQFLQ
jgi:hypothetical protein